MRASLGPGNHVWNVNPPRQENRPTSFVTFAATDDTGTRLTCLYNTLIYIYIRVAVFNRVSKTFVWLLQAVVELGGKNDKNWKTDAKGQNKRTFRKNRMSYWLVGEGATALHREISEGIRWKNVEKEEVLRPSDSSSGGYKLSFSERRTFRHLHIVVVSTRAARRG